MREIKFWFGAVIGIVLAMTAGGAAAEYPDQPIRLIVPYPPSGMTDVFARPLGVKLGERLGQSIIIENRPGAGGTIGTNFVAHAKPDGYTLILGTFGTHAVNDALLADPPYNSLKDFTPVAFVAAVPNVLVVLPTSPYRTLAEIIAEARTKPGTLTHAGTGIGASPHLCIELLKQVAKVDITNVMYNGGGPALVALLSGQVTMIFDAIGTSVPYIKAGKFRPIAVSSGHRLAVLPDVPTVGETLPGFDVVAWYAVWAPAGTPADVVKRLNHEINEVLKMPEIAERFSSIGAEISIKSAEEFADFHRGEYRRWTTFIKETGIRRQ